MRVDKVKVTKKTLIRVLSVQSQVNLSSSVSEHLQEPLINSSNFDQNERPSSDETIRDNCFH